MADMTPAITRLSGKKGALVIKGPLWPHIFMALFGIGWAVSFDAGVRLYGAELLVLAGFLLVRWDVAIAKYANLRSILLIYGCWIGAITFSDLVNGTSVFDTLRNIATPVLGGASLVIAVAVMSRQFTSIFTFLFATVLAKAIFGDAAYGDTFADIPLSFANISDNTNLFKVRVDPFLTPAILLLACWAGRKKLQKAAAVLLISSICYFALDARSSGLVFFVSAVVLYAFALGIKPRLSQILVASFTSIFVIYLAFASYVNYTLKYNADGHNGIQLASLENPYNALALVQRGRSEWTVMPTAISEKPIFGWGSWAEDKDRRFTYLRLERTGADVYGYVDDKNSREYIPAHSLVGTAWLWSGLFGFIAMIWLLKVIVRMALKLRTIHSAAIPAIVFFVVMFFWHFLFSPPQHVRLTFPITFAALIVLAGSVKNEKRLQPISNAMPPRAAGVTQP